jgi:hypothetical protein
VYPLGLINTFSECCKTITINANGGAKDDQGIAMGEYVRMNLTGENAGYQRSNNDQEGSELYLIRYKHLGWRVSTKVWFFCLYVFSTHFVVVSLLNTSVN